MIMTKKTIEFRFTLKGLTILHHPFRVQDVHGAYSFRSVLCHSQSKTKQKGSQWGSLTCLRLVTIFSSFCSKIMIFTGFLCPRSGYSLSSIAVPCHSLCINNKGHLRPPKNPNKNKKIKIEILKNSF